MLGLQLADALNRHLNDLGLLDACLASVFRRTLTLAVVGDQSGQVSQTAVDAIASTFLDDAM